MLPSQMNSHFYGNRKGDQATPPKAAPPLNQPYRIRHRKPVLEAFSIQMNPQQTEASGSLYEYNPTVATQSTVYDSSAGVKNGDASSPGIGYTSTNEARVQPFSFACELAHGSNQVRISGFANIPQLYQRIAESFSIPVSQIMYCTLDTPQVDMSKLLGNQLSFNHVIYAHTRGQTKEVGFIKSAEALGLTVSDNKAGGVFVKRISPSGLLAGIIRNQPDSICPGDLIECINGRSFINSRHMDVVKYLKELPLQHKIVLRLISPEKSPLPGISKRQRRLGGVGRQTIRITATGAEVTEALNRNQIQVLRRLGDAVEDFVGIADEELAQSIFDLLCQSNSKNDFLVALDKQHSEFKFPPGITDRFWRAYVDFLEASGGFRN